MPLGPITVGKDFNFFAEESFSSVTEYPDEPQMSWGIRGPLKIMFICTSGELYYSFNGNTDHGKVAAAEPSEKLEFGTRQASMVWWRGTGDVEVHVWHIGV
jgi:hypothetical protein